MKITWASPFVSRSLGNNETTLPYSAHLLVINFSSSGLFVPPQKTSVQANPALKPTPYDTVSFSGKQETLEGKLSAFADEIEEHVLNNKRFSHEKVKKIIQKHHKGANVLPICRMPDDLPEEEGLFAYCHDRVKAEPRGGVSLISCLYIDKPRPKLPKTRIKFEDKVEFINDLNLAFIRLLQSQDDKKGSCVSLIEEYLKDKKPDKKNISKAIKPREIFILNTNSMANRVQDAVKMKQTLPTSMPEANEEYLNELVKAKTGKDLEIFLRTIINNIISQTNVELTSEEEGDTSFMNSPNLEDEAEFLKSLELIINTDDNNADNEIYKIIEDAERLTNGLSDITPVTLENKYMLDFIERLAKNEAEALALALERTKKHLGIKGPTDKDLIVMLYKKLGEVAGGMKQECQHRMPKGAGMHHAICGIVQ